MTYVLITKLAISPPGSDVARVSKMIGTDWLSGAAKPRRETFYNPTCKITQFGAFSISFDDFNYSHNFQYFTSNFNA